MKHLQIGDTFYVVRGLAICQINIKSIDDAVRCTRIDPKIKDNAMLILSNPDLMKIYDEIIKCFE